MTVPVRFGGVSTLLPVYLQPQSSDAAAQLLRAVESVLTQDCPIPLELLIIDDGSPLPVSELVELKGILDHPAVSLLRVPRNHGLVFALNAGLNRARYDLIARIDADDRWRPSKLRAQLAALSADPDLTLVGTGMRTIHRDHSRDRDHVRGPGWPALLEFSAAVGCPFPHGSILARKEIFSLLGGYSHSPRFQHAEDFALWSVWLRFFKATMLEDVLFEYTVSEEQISKRYLKEQTEATDLIHEASFHWGDHGAIPDAVARLARSLQRPLLETGKLLYAAWRYYSHILTDPEIFEPVRILMPDRDVHSYARVADLLADRFAYIHLAGEFDRTPADHLRCLHGISDLGRIICRHER